MPNKFTAGLGLFNMIKLKTAVVEPIQVLSGDGAITIKAGTAVITKGSAAAITIAAPVSGNDDGKKLVITSTTAQAHTVTNTSPGFNNNGAASDVGTFAAAKGNGMTLVAYQGAWYVTSNIGVTLA